MSGSRDQSWIELAEAQAKSQAATDILNARTGKRRRSMPPSSPTSEELLTGFEKMLAWHAESVAKGLDDPRLMPARVAVRVMPSVYLNAVTVPGEHDGVLLVFNAGLSMFLYKFARAITAQLSGSASGDAGQQLARPVALEETTVRLATLLDWATSPAMTPRSGTWPMTTEALRAAENCAQVAERFAVCHELAHVALDHVKDAPRQSIALGGLNVIAMENIDKREFAADQRGLEFALRTAGTSAHDLQKAYLGCELFFSAIQLYEDVLGVPGGYPPARHRLQAVRAWADKHHPAGLRAVARHYATVIDPLLRTVPDAVQGQRALAGIQTQYLFNRYAEQPEREGQPAFFDKVSPLLSRAPGAVLGIIDRELHTPQLDAGGEITPAGLRRWNLAHAFANNLPDDLRQVMLPWKRDG